MNNIKPQWLFAGGFLVLSLWLTEFANRQRVGFSIPQSSQQLTSSTEYQPEKPAEPNTPEVNTDNRLQPHRNSSLSESSRKLMEAANRQLPVMKDNTTNADVTDRLSFRDSPFRDNDPLHAADQLYGCVGGNCLSAFDDQ